MQARRIKGQVTDQGELVVQSQGELPPGEVEVIVLYPEPAQPRRRTLDVNEHPAFGLWSDRPEAQDSAAYSRQLRRQLEARGDARA